jgi:uridine kinase
MVIGIGGVSRAGKTTLAIKLKRRLKGKTINILNQDDFVKKTGLPTIHGHIDWEHPDSLDWKSLRAAVLISSRNYDITIVEGLFAFYDQTINRKYDHSLFVHIQKELFFKRKRADTRWGKEPDWFIHHIWSSYKKFGQLPVSLKEVLWIEGNTFTDIDQIEHYIS